MIGFDMTYMLYVMLPCMALALWAQLKVKSAYHRAAKIQPRSGLSGAEAAAMIMNEHGHQNVAIEQVEGFMTDHYDPSKKVLRLSPDVYNGRSLAALGIAAHEAGHALQDAQKYTPLVLRNFIVPAASIGSNLSYLLLIGGMIIGSFNLAVAGVALFGVVVAFQLINLPCEFNASSRARQQLLTLNMVTAEEDREVKRVLDAAAMTYVAAVISAVATLLYYMWRLGLLGGSRDD